MWSQLQTVALDDIADASAHTIECKNLSVVSKFVLRELLLRSAVSQEAIIDSSSIVVQHFLMLMEACLIHGLAVKRKLFKSRKDLWSVVLVTGKINSSSNDIIISCENMTHLKTNCGKFRAWLRIAIMQKRLVEFLYLFSERKRQFEHLYEEWSFVFSEYFNILIGFLIGINTFDCNFSIRNDDLDNWSTVVDYALYFKSSATSIYEDVTYREQQGDLLERPVPHVPESEVQSLRSQRSYLEGMNERLNVMVVRLNHEVDGLREQLQSERAAREEHAITAPSRATQSELCTADVCSSDSSMEMLKQRYLEAIEVRNQVELRAIEDQRRIVSLQRQIDEVKRINVEVCRQMVQKEVTISTRENVIASLEAEGLRISEAPQTEDIQVSPSSNMDNFSDQTRMRSQQFMNRHLQTQVDRLRNELKVQRDNLNRLCNKMSSNTSASTPETLSTTSSSEIPRDGNPVSEIGLWSDKSDPEALDGGTVHVGLRVPSSNSFRTYRPEPYAHRDCTNNRHNNTFDNDSNDHCDAGEESGDNHAGELMAGNEEENENNSDSSGDRQPSSSANGSVATPRIDELFVDENDSPDKVISAPDSN